MTRATSVTSSPAASAPRSDRLKRLVDVVGASAMLAAAAPLLAVSALAIRASMGSPVLERQRRPGLHGQLFTLLKLRTMRPGDADDATRTTPLGRVLRKTSVDELPQLWNVLVGDMSLVGPRPLLERYLPRYTPAQARRHAVRPGLTGWAQVHGRNDQTWAERLALDVWYVDHGSLWLDLRVLAMTVRPVLCGRGVSAMPEFTGA